MIRRTIAALWLSLLLAACPSGDARPARITGDELARLHERLVAARAELAAHPESARRVGILVEPFGSQRHADVQAFMNAQRAPLWACLAGDADADVAIAYDARAIVDVAAFDARGTRRPAVEACLAPLLAASPLARPVAPGRILLVPAALAPRGAPSSSPATTAPGGR